MDSKRHLSLIGEVEEEGLFFPFRRRRHRHQNKKKMIAPIRALSAVLLQVLLLLQGVGEKRAERVVAAVASCYFPMPLLVYCMYTSN